MSKSKSKRKSPLVAAADKEGKKDGKNKRKHVEEQQKHRKNTQDDDDAEERRLTSLLFGGTTNLLDNEDNYKDNHQIVVSNNEEEESNNNKIIIHGGEGRGDNNNNLFELDTRGDVDNSMGLVTATEDDNEDDEDEEEEEDQIVPKKKKKKDDDVAAWVDDDDVHLNLESRNRLKKLKKYRDEDVSNISGNELESRLRTRFQESSTLNVRTDWAAVKDNDDKTMEDASAIPILASSTTKLPPEILSVRRCPNANQQDCNNATLKSIHFHPSGTEEENPLLLTAGLDKTLRFFKIHEEGSEKIHGIQFPKLPITCANFLGDSGQVAISGKRPFFYTYDMIHGKLDCIPKIMNRKGEKTWEKFIPSSDGKKIAFLGNDGYIVFVDVKSKQYMYDVKINGKVNTVAFSSDNNTIYAGGNDGDIYQFDLRKRRCIERYQSDDGTTITSLSTSPNNHLAVGSDSGVMNLYSNYSGNNNRTFLKSAMNLQTFVDTSVFNHDGQILGYASSSEKNALRLMHIPTQTIFSNWPTINTPLKHVTTMDFSPSSKYLAIGNNKGDCLLYKLMHYY